MVHIQTAYNQILVEMLEILQVSFNNDLIE